MWLVSSLIWLTIGRSAATRPSTAARVAFEFAADGGRGGPEPVEEIVDRSPAAIGVAGQEGLQSLGAQPAGVGWGGVALEEGQRDRAVDVGEDRGGAGPEAVEVGAQLVGQRDAGVDEVFAGAHERAQRRGLVARRGQRGEAVMVGAGQLAEHHAVERVGLAGGGTEAIAGGLDLVGMDRHNGDAGGEQPADEQPVGAFDRHPLDTTGDQLVDERADAPLVVGEAALQQRLTAVAVGDPDVMPLTGPVDPADCAHAPASSLEVLFNRADQEVPWRVLIGRPSAGRRPVAALGASHRQEGQVSRGPSDRQATEALSWRWQALCAAQCQAAPSLRSGEISLLGKENNNNLTASAGTEVAL
jgi:hypothetical protein